LEAKNREGNYKMLNIILDIDGTLVDARENLVPSPHSYLKMKTGGDFHVYLRPRLNAFLDWLFENFHVSLWTAGSEPYARWIAQNVVGLRRRNGALKHVLSARDCQTSLNMYGMLKSLKYFNNIDPSINLSNAILIDDTLSNCLGQQQNCILVPAFSATVPDRELEILPAKIIKQFGNLSGHFS
jgi:hypothetical protein